MSDVKITAFTELTGVAIDDWVYVVDKSNTTDDPAGSSRKVKLSNLFSLAKSGSPTLVGPVTLSQGTNITLTQSGNDIAIAAAGGGGGSGDLLSTLINSPVSVTGTLALDATAYGKLHVCTGTSADYTVTLPAPSAGKIIGFRFAPLAALSKLVTIARNGSEKIAGVAANRVFWANEMLVLLSDGTDWFKLLYEMRPMACTMRRSSAQTGVVTGVMTKVSLDATVLDNTSLMADPTTNNRINIKRAGEFDITGTVIWSAIGQTTRCITRVDLTGTPVAQTESFGPSGGFPSILARNVPVVVAAGDYLELNGYQDSGSNQTIYGIGSGATTVLSCLEVPSW